MYAVGVVEIIAGILVAVLPRIGGWVVAAWLLGIIVSLLTVPGFFDVALRDFGLLVAAIALARSGIQVRREFAHRQLIARRRGTRPTRMLSGAGRWGENALWTNARG